jgi:hypothetical protein
MTADRGFRHIAWKVPPAFSKANDVQIVRGKPRQEIRVYVIAAAKTMRKGIINLQVEIDLC